MRRSPEPVRTSSFPHEATISALPWFGAVPLALVCTDVLVAVALGATLLLAVVATALASAAWHRAARDRTAGEASSGATGNAHLALALIVATTVVTTLELAMLAWRPALHAHVGAFLPLCVVACVAQAIAARRAQDAGIIAGVRRGLVLLSLLVVLGALREAIGHGTLFAGIAAQLGVPVPEMRISPRGWLVAVLPPGAFLLLSLLLSLRPAKQTE